MKFLWSLPADTMQLSGGFSFISIMSMMLLRTMMRVMRVLLLFVACRLRALLVSWTCHRMFPDGLAGLPSTAWADGRAPFSNPTCRLAQVHTAAQCPPPPPPPPPSSQLPLRQQALPVSQSNLNTFLLLMSGLTPLHVPEIGVTFQPYMDTPYGHSQVCHSDLQLMILLKMYSNIQPQWSMSPGYMLLSSAAKLVLLTCK